MQIKKLYLSNTNGKIVFRAILRLTKGSFVAADERKTIEFVDVTVKSEPHENKAEELVLFLERYYQSGLSEQEIRKAVNLTAMLVKEKAEKLTLRNRTFKVNCRPTANPILSASYRMDMMVYNDLDIDIRNDSMTLEKAS